MYKSEQQKEALERFDELLAVVSSAPSVQVLSSWPMDAYLQRGGDWLKILQTVIADRMEVLASVVDVDRRLFEQRSLNTKYNIVQNMLQH